jgi:hypothetical protein
VNKNNDAFWHAVGGVLAAVALGFLGRYLGEQLSIGGLQIVLSSV